MVGERGIGSNSYTLFLIFMLLYLSQQGARPGSVSSKGGIPEVDYQEKPLKEKAAAGMSDGEAVDYYQDNVFEDDQIVDNDYQQDVQVEPEETEQAGVDFSYEVPEEFVEDIEEDIEQEYPEELAKEINVEETIEPEQSMVGFSPQMPNIVMDGFFSNKSFEIEPDNEVTEIEPPKFVPEEEESEVLEPEASAEPLTGGQNNLFLIPSVKTGNEVKKEQTGPKISINFRN